MTIKQQTILSALSIIPQCPLQLSLKTKIPWREAKRMMDKLADKNELIRTVKGREVTYRLHNPRTRLKNEPGVQN